MKQCREHNCPLQDICRGAVDNSTWWNIGEDCEIFAFVNAQADKIFSLENRLKECENGYEGTLHLESCKLHDAEEKVKELTEENERLKGHLSQLKHRYDICKQNAETAKIDTVRKMQQRLKERAMPVTGGKGFEGVNCMATNLLIDQIAKELLEGE